MKINILSLGPLFKKGYDMSRLKTRSKGMTVISYFKRKSSKWKQHKHSYCN